MLPSFVPEVDASLLEVSGIYLLLIVADKGKCNVRDVKHAVVLYDLASASLIA